MASATLPGKLLAVVEETLWLPPAVALRRLRRAVLRRPGRRSAAYVERRGNYLQQVVHRRHDVRLQAYFD